MPPSDLYLVRHGESVWNAEGRWQGQADPELTERGMAQARTLAEHFPDVEVTHVLSSDLQRARRTAEPFAARFGLELEIDVDLREIDVGSWSGRTGEEIRATEPDAFDLYSSGVAGWQGGERFEEHEVRCRRAATTLASIETDGVVVAVTHGATIRALVRTLLEFPHTERWRFTGPPHTSLTHLAHSPLGWRLVAYGAVLDVRRS